MENRDDDVTGVGKIHKFGRQNIDPDTTTENGLWTVLKITLFPSRKKYRIPKSSHVFCLITDQVIGGYFKVNYTGSSIVAESNSHLNSPLKTWLRCKNIMYWIWLTTNFGEIWWASEKLFCGCWPETRIRRTGRGATAREGHAGPHRRGDQRVSLFFFRFKKGEGPRQVEYTLHPLYIGGGEAYGPEGGGESNGMRRRYE